MCKRVVNFPSTGKTLQTFCFEILSQGNVFARVLDIFSSQQAKFDISNFAHRGNVSATSANEGKLAATGATEKKLTAIAEKRLKKKRFE